MIQSYRDLEVYKRAMGLLVPLHQQLLKFPEYEKFELCSQMRRCSQSIPAIPDSNPA
jgi:four helix bundle protein